MKHAKEAADQVKMLNEKRKNPWQAPPITHREPVFVRKERHIEDLAPNQLRIQYTSSEGLAKTNVQYVKVKMPTSEKNFIKHSFDVGKSDTIVWTLDEAMFKVVDKKEFVLKLQKTKFLIWGKEDLDEKKLRPSELANKCELSKDIKVIGGQVVNIKF